MRAGQEGIKIAGVTGIRAWKKRNRESAQDKEYFEFRGK
jgi:hypothetical protein